MADFFWDRIEPHTRDPELEEGLQARLADPLWLLSRQWQLGEFRGEDAASPIHVRATVEHFPLASFRNGAVPGAPASHRTRRARTAPPTSSLAPDRMRARPMPQGGVRVSRTPLEHLARTLLS